MTLRYSTAGDTNSCKMRKARNTVVTVEQRARLVEVTHDGRWLVPLYQRNNKPHPISLALLVDLSQPPLFVSQKMSRE